jgi:spore maturation protein CgeB
MFDYMYSGKPLLLSLDSPNNPAEVSGCSLVVTPESPQEIVRGIKQLVSMTSKARKEMGNLGKSYVIDHHTYQALSKKYLDLII